MNNLAWDTTFRFSVEAVNLREQKILQQTRTIAHLEEEIRKKDEEIKKRDEELKALKETDLMQTNSDRNENSFPLEKWMQDQIEGLRSSNEQLCTNAMKVYKAIFDKELSKAQCTTIFKRREITDEIEKLEGLCERVSNYAKNVNEEINQDVTNHLQNHLRHGTVAVQEPLDEEPIDRFLGSYITLVDTVHWKSFEIRKAVQNGHYELCLISKDGHLVKKTWIPDNVENIEDGVRVWIEGDTLKMSRPCQLMYESVSGRYIETFEICVLGLKWRDTLYIRV